MSKSKSRMTLEEFKAMRAAQRACPIGALSCDGACKYYVFGTQSIYPDFCHLTGEKMEPKDSSYYIDHRTGKLKRTYF